MAQGTDRAGGPAAFDPFLLLGHHRSGTNFVTDVLQEHSQISFIDEPLSMHTRGFPATDLQRWRRSEYSEVGLHHELADFPGTRSFFTDLQGYVLSAPPGTARGFKETLLFEKLEWLNEAIPGIRVLRVVRDPRAVVVSLLKHDIDGMWGYLVRLSSYFRRHPDSPVEARLGSQLDRCITSWRVRHHEFAIGHRDVPHLTVHLEDLVLRDEFTLSHVMHFLGPPMEVAQLALKRRKELASRGGTYSTHRTRDDVLHGWRLSLSHADAMLVSRLCATEMNSLAYPLD